MPVKISNADVGERAMKIVEHFELQNGRISIRVHREGVGYDLRSSSSNEERLIEVKGVTELWSTYNWQSLYKNEVDALNNYPDKFFLYIVHFERNTYPQDFQLFVIPGIALLSEPFRIVPESYALRPVSRARLKPFEKIGVIDTD